MDEPKLEWIYRNSSEVVDKEEYLLGKPIDKAFEQAQSSFTNEIEKDCLPTSIFSNVGSNLQVDVIRKLKEDPLELIRQQEIERRKQLLKNPVKLKKLQNMLKVKENGSSISNKSKEKMKKDVDDSSDIDKLLTSKYLKIMKKHGIKSLSELSNMKVDKKKASKKIRKSSSQCSSSSSTDSESDEKHAKKHKVDLRKKWSQKNSNSGFVEDSKKERHNSYKNGNSCKSMEPDKHFKNRNYNEDRFKSSHSKLSSQRINCENHTGIDKFKGMEYKRNSKKGISKEYNCRLDNTGDKKIKFKSHGLSDIEKQKRLEEMMENAKWRDEVRSKNIARYKKEESSEKIEENYSEDFLRKQMILATSHESVESRIKSNINNIQKSKFTMNENFVRR